MKTLSKISFGAWRLATALMADCRGIAAIEFAVIVPIMLVMFFGTVEISSAVAVGRKVTLMARTLSDLASQSTSVDDTAIANFFAAGGAIMTPYAATPIKATISELFIDPSTLQARVQWSQPYGGGATRARGSTVAIPTTLAVAGTYLMFAEVSYLYTPAVGYVMAKAGKNLNDVAYTRPRQSLCVLYSPATACTTF
jgi:Flp pilus assembly protein TadG